MKKYFITGLLIWVPLVITAWVVAAIVRTMDQSLLLLPHAIHPETLLGFYLPGLGALLTMLIVFLTGLVTANIVGQRLVHFWETAHRVAEQLDDEHISVFIPTAPSPVNGFFFFVKKSETIELDISVDDALKYIVSMGVVVPTHLPKPITTPVSDKPSVQLPLR